MIVNHFSKTAAITTKVGLVWSLKNLRWDPDGANVDVFFPRCYDLIGPEAVADFLVDFRWSAAAAILKRVAVQGGCGASVSSAALDAALAVCSARLKHIKFLVEDDGEGEAPPLPDLSDAAWKALLESPAFSEGERLPVVPEWGDGGEAVPEDAEVDDVEVEATGAEEGCGDGDGVVDTRSGVEGEALAPEAEDASEATVGAEPQGGAPANMALGDTPTAVDPPAETGAEVARGCVANGLGPPAPPPRDVAAAQQQVRLSPGKLKEVHR